MREKKKGSWREENDDILLFLKLKILFKKVNLKTNKMTLEISLDFSFLEP